MIYHSIQSAVAALRFQSRISFDKLSPKKHLLHIFACRWFVFLVFCVVVSSNVSVASFVSQKCVFVLLPCYVVLSPDTKTKIRSEPFETYAVHHVRFWSAMCDSIVVTKNINKDRKTEASYRCSGHLVRRIESGDYNETTCCVSHILYTWPMALWNVRRQWQSARLFWDISETATNSTLTFMTRRKRENSVDIFCTKFSSRFFDWKIGDESFFSACKLDNVFGDQFGLWE